MTWAVDPVLVRVAGLEVRWYGVMFGLAIVLGFLAWYREAIRGGESPRFAESWLWWSLPAVLIGGRLGHVFFYEPRTYLANPIDILRVWHGGMASHGVAVALAIASWLFARHHERPWLRVLDYAAPNVAVGAACVRVGNFFNSEIVGRGTDVPWGVVFARNDALARHPSQLYEAGAALLALALIYLLRRRRIAPAGIAAGTFLVTYFGLRFVLEFWKDRMVEQLLDPGTPLWGVERWLGIHLTTGQWLSAPAALVGAVVLVRVIRREPTPETARSLYPGAASSA